MSIVISDLSYHYPNQHPLFEQINLTVVSGRKVAVVGDNGTGKSTLLKLVAGELTAASGSIRCSSSLWYVPQQSNSTNQSVGEALGVAAKLEAIKAICEGSTDPRDYDTLAGDWEIESRCRLALDTWGLSFVNPATSSGLLSGGEKTRLFLAGLLIHQPGIVLLDEPTNHLDLRGREKLYEYIRTCKATLMVVSHDITLLNLLEATYEVSSKGIRLYGGNYDFYREQKAMEDNALDQQVTAEQTALQLARKKAQLMKERQEKRCNQGERHKDQLPRAMRKKVKDSGEATAARLKDKHSGLVEQSYRKLEELRHQQLAKCELKIDCQNIRLHTGKLLIAASGLNFAYDGQGALWPFPVDLEIRSGDRLHITGDNGTGKTTLVKLLTGELAPDMGEIRRADFSFVYLDQEYSRINTPQTVLELAQEYNCCNLPDHEIRLRLSRALFQPGMWDKRCQVLSGGERMRLYLCCLMISNQVPDLFMLDEPTNNLDLSSLTILARTISGYRGTLVVIAHDRSFVREIGITKTLELFHA